MSLEGLRAWIGEVERKLGKRTRVFLALTAIAIGIAGASVYLAIDTRSSSVSESDVQALQQQLETRVDELAAGGTTPPATAPTEPANPEGKSGARGNGASGSSNGGASSKRLQELLKQAE